jgi:hypothetical protein
LWLLVVVLVAVGEFQQAAALVVSELELDCL